MLPLVQLVVPAVSALAVLKMGSNVELVVLGCAA